MQSQVGPVHSVVHNVSRKTDAMCNGVLCDIPTLGFTCDQAVVHTHKDKWCTVRPAASFVCVFFHLQKVDLYSIFYPRVPQPLFRTRLRRAAALSKAVRSTT